MKIASNKAVPKNTTTAVNRTFSTVCIIQQNLKVELILYMMIGVMLVGVMIGVMLFLYMNEPYIPQFSPQCFITIKCSF